MGEVEDKLGGKEMVNELGLLHTLWKIYKGLIVLTDGLTYFFKEGNWVKD